jgi:hypothetical protein
MAAPMALTGCATAARKSSTNHAATPSEQRSLDARKDWLAGQSNPIADGPAQAVQVVRLSFTVLQVQLPVDRIRHAAKIWNHVDESRLEPALVTRLVRNGIRVGAGSAAGWPAVAAILEGCKAKCREDRLISQSDLPLTLLVGTIEEPESLFQYGQSQSLTGRTFESGEKLITLEYAYRQELGGAIDLEVLLEVRQDLHRMDWENRNGVFQEVPAMERHVFGELRAPVSLRPAEFLVIGPSEKADHDYLVGSRFFTRRDPGSSAFETLFFITPQPHSSHSGTRSPS